MDKHTFRQEVGMWILHDLTRLMVIIGKVCGLKLKVQRNHGEWVDA